MISVVGWKRRNVRRLLKDRWAVKLGRSGELGGEGGGVKSPVVNFKLWTLAIYDGELNNIFIYPSYSENKCGPECEQMKSVVAKNAKKVISNIEKKSKQKIKVCFFS